MKEPEHVEQRQLFRWIAMHEARVPELRLAYAIPNGRKRTEAEAGKLKAEGVRRGVPDVALDVARRGHHGLRIEMKAPGKLKDTSAEQDEWHRLLRAEGYLVVVCDRWQLAWNQMMTYLDRYSLLLDPTLIPPLR